MPKITIDGREVEVDAGTTILTAAEKLGISIPTMCYQRGHEAMTSCMACVVKVAGMNGLVPACGVIVRDGMQVQNDCQEVLDARKAALKLLLSDHVGDCVGPCQMGCPAHMNIPLMIRQIEQFIEQKVDLLVIGTNDEKAVVPVVAKAYKSGIPVIVLDRGIKGTQYTTFINSDNRSNSLGVSTTGVPST